MTYYDAIDILVMLSSARWTQAEMPKDDDIKNAIDLIITYMVRDKLGKIVMDIAEHDQALVPPKRNDFERDRKGIRV